jgi:hypothetical protein
MQRSRGAGAYFLFEFGMRFVGNFDGGVGGEAVEMFKGM